MNRNEARSCSSGGSEYISPSDANRAFEESDKLVRALPRALSIPAKHCNNGNAGIKLKTRACQVFEDMLRRPSSNVTSMFTAKFAIYENGLNRG